LYNKGNALVKLGNYNGAISYYDKVLSFNSTNAKALKGKSDVQAKLDKQKSTTTSPNVASTPISSTK
jgi:tetratricopeptide (TPR) repeat protein